MVRLGKVRVAGVKAEFSGGLDQQAIFWPFNLCGL